MTGYAETRTRIGQISFIRFPTMSTKRLRTGCSLSRKTLERMQRGTLSYKYKDVPMLKDPFDLALYQLLLWEQKPRTLFEIGSFRGGSALWLADLMTAYGVDYTIVSIDPQPPSLTIPGVSFRKGDGRNLASILTVEDMTAVKHPMLVIEDADHHPATTLAVLRFFDRWTLPGEYIIIEDGIVDDLYNRNGLRQLEGGPRPAIAEFLRERETDYEIDTELCDYFGVNVTWNVNGYLRRKS